MDFAFERARHDRAGNLRPRDDLWKTPDTRVLVLGGEHVATIDGPALRWTTVDEAPDGEWILLGDQNGTRHAAVAVQRVPRELSPVSIRVLAPLLGPDELSLAIHAVGLARWLQSHTYCSRCGEYLYSAQAGHLRVCPSCGTEHYPRTDPAVIMLVTDEDDRCLLARNPNWPEGRFSTLAGFVEPGETLEDAVRREVAEEVGITVGGATYLGSQPWPFPQSLMLGFRAVAESTDFTLDDKEIAEARWFTREELVQAIEDETVALPPPKVSISRWLVEQWYGGDLPGTWS
ncbi:MULTISPECIES: NAD(+) diphosphatase [Aeromicrobium]|uniref:NAD(+) diphosphatase n=1 Tax=Aeromicrobium TaxID=2040 RepID=UPI002581169E|nr:MULTISPECIES: NAD(+) diphosphatase [Aeromicrobium]